jgi:hypothetical protein
MTKTLFNQPLCHTKDVETSFEAADKMVESGKLTEQEQEVFKMIQHYCNRLDKIDFTPKELAAWTKQSPIWSHITYIVIQRRLSGIYNNDRIERIDKYGKTYREGRGQKLMKRNNCAVWRIV